jgi:hypothetical protein
MQEFSKYLIVPTAQRHHQDRKMSWRETVIESVKKFNLPCPGNPPQAKSYPIWFMDYFYLPIFSGWQSDRSHRAPA